jgi:ferredoxin-NADP reductase
VPYLAGQHFVVRLSAPDGYRAQRSYSVASPPDGSASASTAGAASAAASGAASGSASASAEIELTVERLEGGEVSSFLHDAVEIGDELEVRGPIGGWFVWKGDTQATLIGGGSGVVPLMAMLRQARRSGRSDLVRLVVSARSPSDLYYADELPGPETTIVYTRDVPPDWPRPPGRLAATDLPPVRAGATSYVCGSTGFANSATGLLEAVGVPADHIRVERFGPTG